MDKTWVIVVPSNDMEMPDYVVGDPCPGDVYDEEIGMFESTSCCCCCCSE